MNTINSINKCLQRFKICVYNSLVAHCNCFQQIPFERVLLNQQHPNQIEFIKSCQIFAFLFIFFFVFFFSSTLAFAHLFRSLTHSLQSLTLFLFSFSFITFYLKVLLLLTSVIKSTWDFTNSLSSRSLYNKFNAIFAI